MGAYLRSVVQVRRWTGRKLPRLKWWAKAVFGLYMCMALPAIAFLLFAMLNATPRILMTAWQAIQRQSSEIAGAQARGDAVALVSAEAQLLLLLLPAAGLCLMLFSLGHAAARGLWRWGRPTPARRLAASVVAASAAAFVVLLWVPELRPVANARVLDWGHAQAMAAAEPTLAALSTATATATPTATATATATASPTATPEATAPPTQVVQVIAPTAAAPTQEPRPTEISRDVPIATSELADDAPTPRATALPTPRATTRPPSRTSQPSPAAPRLAPPQPARSAPTPAPAASHVPPKPTAPSTARLTGSPARP
jgi:hypothetical protein